MKYLLRLSVLFLVVAAVSTAGAGVKDEVAQVLQRRIQAIHEGNAEAVAALFAEDAHYISDRTPFRVEGRAAIQASYAGLFRAYPTVRIVTGQSSIQIYNDTTAVCSEYYILRMDTGAGDGVVTEGRATLTLAKTGGRWVIVQQHTSPLLPTFR